MTLQPVSSVTMLVCVGTVSGFYKVSDHFDFCNVEMKQYYPAHVQGLKLLVLSIRHGHCPQINHKWPLLLRYQKGKR